MLEALLFDLDGTLTDTDKLHLPAFQQLLAEHGRTLSAEEFETHCSGRANPVLFAYLFPEHSVAERAALADRKEALFRAMAPTLEPIPGLMRLLDFAKAKSIRMAVVTNAPRANAEHMLDALGLSSRFDALVIAEELPLAKPDPLPYLTGLERLKGRAEAALAFEDSVPGLTAAVKAGVFTVGLSTSQSPQALLDAGAHLVIADFEDERLWQVVDRFISQTH